MRALAVFLTSIFILSGCTTVVDSVTSKPFDPDPSSTSMGTAIDDIKMDTFIGVNIKKADPQLDKSHININVVNRVVLLTGEVPTAALKKKAGDVARAYKDVRQVYNELQVRGKTSIVSRTNDTLLTGKIKTKLMFNDKIKASNIEVVTEDSVVYLMGTVDRATADLAGKIASDSSGVRKVVRVFEYID
ncbi:BON domain-containing protein [Porticoccaceae bacterium]|nr:BON domain-containing protein [Porticoccaceae bacterium]